MATIELGDSGSFMAHPMSESLFHQFSELVYEQCGINLHEGKRTLLEARLAKRLRATRMDCPEEYYRYITSAEGRAELIHFLDSVSTNLTAFFREVQHFEYLERQVLPQIVERKRAERRLRLRAWSAACSTGEEPYSIAMTVLSVLERPETWDFKILATDISTKVLAIAEQGRYSRERLAKVPEAYRRLFFRRSLGGGSADTFEVIPEIRRIVAFRRLNLQEPYPFHGPFDFIFCRNVMIYFDKPTQESLINRMAAYLAPGGYFFVGHAESLTGLKHPLTYVRPAVYRK